MPPQRKGTGGHGRRKLTGKGPTPKAEMRPGHPARRKAARVARADDSGQPDRAPTAPRSGRRPAEPSEELVIGRNSVIEALRARVPGTALLRALGTENDPRTIEAAKLAER